MCRPVAIDVAYRNPRHHRALLRSLPTVSTSPISGVARVMSVSYTHLTLPTTPYV